MRGIFTVAKVAISRAAYSFDCEYSYIVPPELKEYLTIGARVLIPFGKGNKKTIGFVTRTYEDIHFNENLKPMISIIDTPSLLTDEMLKIIFWLKDNTFCTYFDAFKTVVPTGFSYNFSQHYALANKSLNYDELTQQEVNALEYLKNVPSKREVDKFLDITISTKRKKLVESLLDKGFLEEVSVLKRKTGDETVKMVRLSDKYHKGVLDLHLTARQNLVVKLLEDCGCASVKEVCYMTNCTNAIVKRLISKEVLTEFTKEVLRNAIGEINEKKDVSQLVLNDEQQSAYIGISKLIDDNKPSGALLYGVTGSGKTAVFFHVIDYVLQMNKTALVLVPEISLTPQMVNKFKSYFGENIAVLHSSLSLGQRMDEFKRIKNGDAKIVIGTRSAIFAPLSNIGVIMQEMLQFNAADIITVFCLWLLLLRHLKAFILLKTEDFTCLS